MNMRNQRLHLFIVVFGFSLILPLVADGAEIKIGKKDGKRRSSVELHIEAPSFGPPPRGYIYGGPYVPSYPYMPPLYGTYGWSPSYPYYPPAPEEYGGQKLIPAGRLMILVDPVSAEVYVDGLLLKQLADLSYEVGLLEGRHEIEVRAKGFESYREEVEIPGGRRIFLTVRLDKR
jgi:hypothetical protein